MRGTPSIDYLSLKWSVNVLSISSGRGHLFYFSRLLVLSMSLRRYSETKVSGVLLARLIGCLKAVKNCLPTPTS